jgi:hypothetical protein
MIENKSQGNIGGMHRGLHLAQGKMLVSSQLDACGPPYSLVLAT